MPWNSVWRHMSVCLQLYNKCIKWCKIWWSLLSDVCQVKLSNPSSKPLIYQAIVSGRDASNFSLPKGRLVTIAPKSSVDVSVEFRSRFMRSSEAVLIMAGRRLGATTGCALVFTLRASVDSITPKVCCCQQHNICTALISQTSIRSPGQLWTMLCRAICCKGFR